LTLSKSHLTLLLAKSLKWMSIQMQNVSLVIGPLVVLAKWLVRMMLVLQTLLMNLWYSGWGFLSGFTVIWRATKGVCGDCPEYQDTTRNFAFFLSAGCRVC